MSLIDMCSSCKLEFYRIPGPASTICDTCISDDRFACEVTANAGCRRSIFSQSFTVNQYKRRKPYSFPNRKSLIGSNCLRLNQLVPVTAFGEIGKSAEYVTCDIQGVIDLPLPEEELAPPVGPYIAE